MRWLAVLALAAGCLHDQGATCSDGRFCPGSLVCDDVHSLCVEPIQLTVCEGAAQYAPCTTPDVLDGECIDSVCLPQLCGNGQVDPGEVCDDGNTVSGDGCRGDCQKMEVCGDQIVDANETCDDGNQNPADGCDECKQTSWTASVLVGAQLIATQSAMPSPEGVAVDNAGRVFVVSGSDHRVWRIDPDGSMTIIAGTGVAGYSGDGGPAISAQLSTPTGIAIDGIGRIYIADHGNERVRLIDLDGTITTIAGTGVQGNTGDNQPAVAAQLGGPYAVAIDALGRVYIAEFLSHRVRMIDGAGVLRPIAGNGTQGQGADGIAATGSQLSDPAGIAIDAAGNIYIADPGNFDVRRVDATTGLISTVAGTPTMQGFNGDGGPATAAKLGYPIGIAIDAQGELVIPDGSNNRIRLVSTSGIITTIAGTGTTGSSGDGGSAAAAQFAFPQALTFDRNGRLLVCDLDNNRVRVIAAGTIDTLAGNGGSGFVGDGGSALSARFFPYDLAIDAAGSLVIADNTNCRIRKVDASGTITTIAGTGVCTYSGDGGPATAAAVSDVSGIAIDAAGNIAFSDVTNRRVRRIDPTGTITTLAGNGTAGLSGDGGPAASAEVQTPLGLTYDAAGNLYFADTDRIRKIDTSGTITRFAGTGSAGFSGDGGPANAAQLAGPSGVAADSAGDIVIADQLNQRIRRVDSAGTITTIAGNGTASFAGDGGAATSAELLNPSRVAVDDSGQILIADAGNFRLRRIDGAGTITTIAGTGSKIFNGDGGPAVAASLNYPGAVAARGSRVVIAEATHAREIASDGTIRTVAGQVDPVQLGPIALSRLANPVGLEVGASATFVAGGASGTLQRIANGHVDVVAGRYPQASTIGALARYRSSTFGTVGGVVEDTATGTIYITDTTNSAVYAVTPVDPTDPRTWTIANVAGFASFRNPTGLFLDASAHVLYIADTGNHAIRAFDMVHGMVTAIANTRGELGFFGDGAAATDALLYQPTAITRCGADLFIADTGNNRVRRIDATGVITTVIGNGAPTSSGIGAPATLFSIDAPTGLACDAAGNLFVTSSTTVRLLVSDEHGVVDGTGQVQTIYGAPPRNMFPVSQSNCLTGLAVTSATTVEVTDACSGLLVQLTRGVP